VNAPQPGDFAVCGVAGDTGKLIALGEWLNGDAFTQYQHAFVYIGDGQIVEAEPGGARRRPVTGHTAELWSSGIIQLSAAQRDAIVKAATGYLGTPYSAADYFALAAHRLRIPAPGLRAYVASSGHMICSQLVDQCYQDAGVHLFTDGRWPGYVTPAALAGLLEHGPV
jgi:cell wall-associated NlpC family hydrolase